MKKEQTVYFLKGLPASGKSTWAKEKVKESHGSVKRINKDDLRNMIDCGKWSREREKNILTIQNLMLEKFLSEGFSVISDNTNLVPKHLEKTKEIISKVEKEKNVKIKLEEIFFDVPVYECIKRDASRGSKSVGEDVIYDMWNRHLKRENPSNPNGPPAFIFDIDGTLALMKDRSPYDWDRVDEDSLNEPIAIVCKQLKSIGYAIIIFTGRNEESKEKTIKWLASNNIQFDHFDIRKHNDKRPDEIIKKEMFDRIKTTYNILGVFDDRNGVCDMWRNIGLQCFQCDYGYF